MTNRQPAYRPNLRSKAVKALALSGIATMMLAGCGGNATGAGNAGSGERVEGGTIRYAHLQEPPCVYGGWVQQAFLSRQVLDSLVSQTDTGEIVPWLAEQWDVSEDQLTWTFTLKPGLKFTDGSALDAAAVSANFEYWQAGGNGTVAAHIGDYYESSSALDETTLQVKLNAPYTPFLSALSQGYFGIQSAQALENRSEQENCEAPIGSGPFAVAQWKRGQSITFTRNDDYASAPANAKHQGPAYVDSLVWSFIQDNTSRFGSLVRGESDVIGEVPTVDFDAAKSQYEVQQFLTPGRPVSLSLNTVNGPFTDVLVRRAFAQSADRQAVVDSAFLGVVPFEGNGNVSASTPGYNAEAAQDYPLNVEQANQLLDQAGWTGRSEDGTRLKDGKELEVKIVFGLNSTVTQEGATALQNLQDQVKQTGFKITLVPATQSEMFSGQFSTPDSYDAQLGYWTSPHAGILHINFRQNTEEYPNPANTTFYNNPEIEQIILQGNSAKTSEEANEYYRQAQQLLSDQAVTVGLYTQTSTLASDPKLQDVWIEASQGEPVFHDAYFTE